MSYENKIEFEGKEYYYNTFSSDDITEYQGLRDMYYGEGGFKDGTYLEPFPRESQGGTDDNGNTLPNFFALRQELAHYENIFASELDAKIDPIFSKDQIREINGNRIDIVQSFIDNPTKQKNESLSEYQRKKFLAAELYGSVFEILDGPDIKPETGMSDLNKELMEYAYFITPLNVYGYGLDSNGVLNLLIYYEDLDTRNNYKSDGTFTGYNKAVDSFKYRVWIKTDEGGVTFSYYQNDIYADTIKRFDEFPVCLIERNQRYKSNVIAKSAYISELSICKKIYNLTSWYNDSFFKNCFAILVYNGRLPDEIDLGSSSILQYFEVGANQPSFIAPPIAHLEIQIKEVERLVQQLQSNMTSTVAISAIASGDARKEADKRRIEKLKQLSNDIQDQEKWLINTALKVYINVDYEYNVIYIKDFETLTKSDELESLISLLDLGLKQNVQDEIKSDAIKIVYSNNKKRGEYLADLQIKTVEETQNDIFN